MSLQGRFAIGSHGEIFLVSWEPCQSQVLLWRFAEEKWFGRVVAKIPDNNKPNWFGLSVDRLGKPIMVLARLNEQHGWIKLLQQKPDVTP
jgi:hypothetical protein